MAEPSKPMSVSALFGLLHAARGPIGGCTLMPAAIRWHRMGAVELFRQCAALPYPAMILSKA